MVGRQWWWAAVPLAAVPLLAAGAVPLAAPKPAAFARCASCHSANKGGSADIGPNLYGVVGSKAGSRPGFDYSPALKASGVTWSRATIAAFIANPQAVAHGTQMPNPGISNPADRDAIAAWLATLK